MLKNNVVILLNHGFNMLSLQVLNNHGNEKVRDMDQMGIDNLQIIQ